MTAEKVLESSIVQGPLEKTTEGSEPASANSQVVEVAASAPISNASEEARSEGPTTEVQVRT